MWQVSGYDDVRPRERSWAIPRSKDALRVRLNSDEMAGDASGPDNSVEASMHGVALSPRLCNGSKQAIMGTMTANMIAKATDRVVYYVKNIPYVFLLPLRPRLAS